MSSTINISDLNSRLETLKTSLDPIENEIKRMSSEEVEVIKNLQSNIEDELTKNFPNMKFEVRLDRNYRNNSIYITEADSRSEISLNLNNYERYSVLSNKDNMTSYDKEKAIFEINTYSQRVSSNNTEALERLIFVGYLANELKDFNSRETIIDLFSDAMEIIITSDKNITEIDKTTYPINREIREIEDKIKAIEKNEEEAKIMEI